MRMTTLTGLVAGLALLAGACGDDAPTASDPTDAPIESAAPTTGSDPAAPVGTGAADPEPVSTEPATTEPATTDSAATEPADDPTAAEGAPTAIVSLSPTATEMLYAIGAGDQVLAVDDFSNYPPEAADKMPGISGYEPNVEAIAGLEPDLIVTDGTNGGLLGQLDSLGIAHWEGPAATSFDDVYTQIEQLGAATGRVAEAAELVSRMQLDIEAVLAGLPQLDQPLTYYHELDNTLFSVTSATFIGAVYNEIGLVNIADSVGDGNPYPQLNAEFIIAENPDLIFLACTKYCGETAETIVERPGWNDIDAVVSGGVIEMDDDIASRWGPRIVEYLEVAGDAVTRAAAVETSN